MSAQAVTGLVIEARRKMVSGTVARASGAGARRPKPLWRTMRWSRATSSEAARIRPEEVSVSRRWMEFDRRWAAMPADAGSAERHWRWATQVTPSSGDASTLKRREPVTEAVPDAV